jgi:hypothetical protein
MRKRDRVLLIGRVIPDNWTRDPRANDPLFDTYRFRR